jgi:hypothetical protein
MATTYTFAVTFEFDEQAPETVRGQIAAHTAQTAASRALKQARKAKPKARARSIVVLLQPAASGSPSAAREHIGDLREPEIAAGATRTPWVAATP